MEGRKREHQSGPRLDPVAASMPFWHFHPSQIACWKRAQTPQILLLNAVVLRDDNDAVVVVIRCEAIPKHEALRRVPRVCPPLALTHDCLHACREQHTPTRWETSAARL